MPDDALALDHLKHLVDRVDVRLRSRARVEPDGDHLDPDVGVRIVHQVLVHGPGEPVRVLRRLCLRTVGADDPHAPSLVGDQLSPRSMR